MNGEFRICFQKGNVIIEKWTYACDTQVLNSRDSVSCSHATKTIFVSTLHFSPRSNSVASALFQKRTSKINLPLLERVQIGKGIPDELGGEPHRRQRGLYKGPRVSAVCWFFLLEEKLVAFAIGLAISLEGEGGMQQLVCSI